MHSQSDGRLENLTGSFKRFDSVDRDFRITITTTPYTAENEEEDVDAIPPQPLRPAPTSLPIITTIEPEITEP